MPDLIFEPPVRIPDHFDVPLDLTAWPTPGRYRRLVSAQTPDRLQATFKSWERGLVPFTGWAKGLKFGVYLLAFDCPYRAFYVGVAGTGSKNPEGILKRIAKHRVKTTGSHVGTTAAGYGGVDHTGGWRKFAANRAIHIGGSDHCADVRLVIGQLGETNYTPILENFEYRIFHNCDGIRDEIYKALWPSEDNKDVTRLTSRVNRGISSPNSSIILW